MDLIHLLGMNHQTTEFSLQPCLLSGCSTDLDKGSLIPIESKDKNGKTAYDLLKMNTEVDSVNKDKCLRCVLEC